MPAAHRKFLGLLDHIRIPLHPPLDCAAIFNVTFTVLALDGINPANGVSRGTITFILKELSRC
jgi:hypothetical protein